MFTGLVQAVGRIAGLEARGTGSRLTIDAAGWDHRPSPGDSISVSGCCLTLAEPPGPRLAFDVVPETLRMTTLGGLAPGAAVNLEHAARADSLLGGHVVQGHVDGIGEVERVTANGEHRVRLRVPPALMEFMTPKGSVCIDGVSLTLAAVDVPANAIEVALIPTTLDKTTLGALNSGDRCNIETDIFARTVVHWLRHFRGA